MPVERVYADPNVKADVGRVALQRGPIVYCLEGVDNNGSVRNLVLAKDAKLTAKFEQDLLNGVTIVKGTALAIARGQDKPQSVEFTAVPYYSWDNREPGQMVVWLSENPALAEPRPAATIAVTAKVSASFKGRADSLDALNDQIEPASSKDMTIPRFTWWDHKGTTEWVQYDFKSPATVSTTEVYFFDDTGIGGCRIPKSWRILYQDGPDWKPVEPTGPYTTNLNAYNRAAFKPVNTPALRLEVQLQAGFSGGILEWRVSP